MLGSMSRARRTRWTPEAWGLWVIAAVIAITFGFSAASSRASSAPPSAVAPSWRRCRVPEHRDRGRPEDLGAGFESVTQALAANTSRRGFLARVGGGLLAAAGAGTVVKAVVQPGEADAYHFCGHIYTTDGCPHPTGVPRIDGRGFPLRASDGARVDDLGRAPQLRRAAAFDDSLEQWRITGQRAAVEHGEQELGIRRIERIELRRAAGQPLHLIRMRDDRDTALRVYGVNRVR